MTDARRPGLIRVTFSAGGINSSVDSNPQAPVLGEDKRSFSVEWVIQREEGTYEDFEVQFGNIVPCNRLALLPHDYDFRSFAGKQVGELIHRWRWEFTPKNKSVKLPTSGLILYDIFFSYQPKVSPMSNPSTVSLRKILHVDPSLILPPKEGPGFPETQQLRA